MDSKEDGHGEGEKADESEDDLKARAFIKFYLSQRISCLSCREREKRSGDKTGSGYLKYYRRSAVRTE